MKGGWPVDRDLGGSCAFGTKGCSVSVSEVLALRCSNACLGLVCGPTGTVVFSLLALFGPPHSYLLDLTRGNWF